VHDSDIQKPSRCWYRSPPSRFCLRTMEFSPCSWRAPPCVPVAARPPLCQRTIDSMLLRAQICGSHGPQQASPRGVCCIAQDLRGDVVGKRVVRCLVQRREKQSAQPPASPLVNIQI
jgi:hypothetical protein